MVRDGGFPIDDQEGLETVARMHGAAGETEAAAVRRSGRCRFELTDHDNWGGGTGSYGLRIQIAAETFVGMGSV